MTSTPPRILSIDMMRGLVMVLMALDHTRDYFSNAMFSPTDLSQTNAAYFFTRWITHLCAPTFVFLAGTSAYLSTKRWNFSTRRLSVYLIRRGVMLIVLEFTLVRFGWSFNWDYSYAIAQVIWVLGWAMIVLAGLVHLPHKVTAIFALTLIVGHNFFDRIQPDHLGNAVWLWTVLHVPGNIEYLPGYTLFVLYPLVPWIAVMAAGYCAGPLFLQAVGVRNKRLVFMGAVAVMLFLLLRLSNVYGDPHPWLPQKNGMFTVFSILNCEKYPPSLLYLLMTLGLMFFGLALFEWQKMHRFSFLLVEFGKAPLLFYLVHILLIHGTAYAVTVHRGLATDWLVSGSAKMPFPEIPAPEYGFEFMVVYGIWLALLVVLYPTCDFYNHKINRKG
jgi:uncharacterized membrane protein